MAFGDPAVKGACDCADEAELGRLSVSSLDVLSAGNGGMCFFPCALCAGKLLGEQPSRAVAGTCPFVPTCGKGQGPKPRGGVYLALHYCTLQPLAQPQGLFESHSLSLKPHLCEAQAEGVAHSDLLPSTSAPQDHEKQYVGFATLPNQVHRKSVKKGFDFTLMVAGETACGWGGWDTQWGRGGNQLPSFPLGAPIVPGSSPCSVLVLVSGLALLPSLWSSPRRSRPLLTPHNPLEQAFPLTVTALGGEGSGLNREQGKGRRGRTGS